MPHLVKPRILGPVGIGDNQIWVSALTPGANVAIMERGRKIGEMGASDPVLAIPVRAIRRPIQAVANIGGDEARSDEVEPLADPGRSGEVAKCARRDVDYGSFRVPRNETPDGIDGEFNAPLRGRLYLPSADGAQPLPGRRPLVIIAHGHWWDDEEDKESYLGYAWLAEQLASWGIAVCSIALDVVNRETGANKQQWSRGEVVLRMITRLLRDRTVMRSLDGDRIALIGHSMGGEGVVLAQELNLRRGRSRGIRGVVNLAPTNYRPEIGARSTAYLQIHGSEDYLLGWATGEKPRFGGFRLYERAWRSRSLVWVYRAGHDAYNSVWWEGRSSTDSPRNDILDAEDQRQIARAFITAFLADVLLGDERYRGYLAGPTVPPSVAKFEFRRQHQGADVEVIDDHGNANEQLLLPEEAPDKATNRRGENVAALGSELERWELVEHVTLAHSAQGTRGLDLAWRGRDVTYVASLGGISVSPEGSLALQIAQHYEERDREPDETWNEIGADIDLEVELSDGRERARMHLGAVAPVGYPYPALNVLIVFQTIRLPFDAFLAVNPALDLDGLRELRLSSGLPPGRAGRVLIDDIEFATTPVTQPSRIALLRANVLRTGFGPPTDFIDAEVVVQLSDRPGETFGLQLRRGPNLAPAQAKLAMLRAALSDGKPVALAHRWVGPTVREILRVIQR